MNEDVNPILIKYAYDIHFMQFPETKKHAVSFINFVKPVKKMIQYYEVMS